MRTVADERFEKTQLVLRLQRWRAPDDLRRGERIYGEDEGIGLHRLAGHQRGTGDLLVLKMKMAERLLPVKPNAYLVKIADPFRKPHFAARSGEQKPAVSRAVRPGRTRVIREVVVSRRR